MSDVVRADSRLSRIVDERIVLWVIAFNMAIVFTRAFPGVMASPVDLPLAVLDYACLVYFFVEISLKVRLTGFAVFWNRNLNRFDFMIVAVSVPALLAPFVQMDDLSWLLVLRGFRLFRFLRVLRFIPNADRVWAGVLRALRASVGLIAALTLYNLVLGLMAARLFADVSPEHFGDPLLSIYTIFKVFTVEGWFDVPDAVAKSHGGTVAWMVRAFFVWAVVTGGLLGLSLTNAVLVDEMVMDNNLELEEQVTSLSVQLSRMEAKLDELTARGPPDA
jgi:voltage-gated sodium channel